MIANIGAIMVMASILILAFSSHTFFWSFVRGKPEMRKVSKKALIIALLVGTTGFIVVKLFAPPWTNEAEIQESSDFIRGVSKPL
jgi:formate hydrogenlyase subunit 3/multisubunit Na+/H+ antiporter MnhD subunit